VTHGHTGNRIGRSNKIVELGRRLAAAGITCVRFDQTGCGESSGDFEAITLGDGVRDVQTMLDWLSNQIWCDPNRIGHVAISMASLLVTAAEPEQPSRGIAMWAPVFDLRAAAMTRGLGEAGELLQQQGWFPYKGLKLGVSFAKSIDQLDMPSQLTRSTSPLYIMHSPDDEIIEYEQAESIVACCQKSDRPCSLHTIEGADHDFNDYPHRQAVIDLTVRFMQERLLNKATSR
jgi:alpha-beta hydrolase superfamily lysophospholipase